MYILFIDTHSKLITVGLANKTIEKIKVKESDNSHSKYLLLMIKELLDENKSDFNMIKEVIVTNGPGSFTGIRIGLSVAKTIAYALNIPIKTISSLAAYLVSNKTTEDKMCVIEENKGNFISVFDKNNESIEEEKYIIDVSTYENKYKKIDNKINLQNIIEYTKNIPSTNVHNIKANYIKKIEVEK